jgi:hypothetical protein
MRKNNFLIENKIWGGWFGRSLAWIVWDNHLALSVDMWRTKDWTEAISLKRIYSSIPHPSWRRKSFYSWGNNIGKAHQPSLCSFFHVDGMENWEPRKSFLFFFLPLAFYPCLDFACLFFFIFLLPPSPFSFLHGSMCTIFITASIFLLQPHQVFCLP